MIRAAVLLFALTVGAVGTARAACPSPTADQTVAVPGHPFAARPSADGCQLYVSLADASERNGALAVLADDGGVFKLAKRVALKYGAVGGLALSHDGRLLAVAVEDAVALIDTARLENDPDPSKAVLAYAPEPNRGAVYVQFSQDDTLLFVSEEKSGHLAVLNVAKALHGEMDRAVVGRLPVGVAPVGLALSADGARLYLVTQRAPPPLGMPASCAPEQGGAGPMHPQGLLIAVDVARAASDPAHAAVAYAPAGCNPVRVALTPDGRGAWVSARGGGEALRFDVATLGLRGGEGRRLSVKVGAAPVGVAVRPDGVQVWVADSDRFSAGSASLSLIAPAEGDSARLAGMIKVGAFPRDLAFLPDGRTLVAALYGAGAVLLHPTSDNLAAAQ